MVGFQSREQILFGTLWMQTKNAWGLRVSFCTNSPRCWHFHDGNILWLLALWIWNVILGVHQSCVLGDPRPHQPCFYFVSRIGPVTVSLKLLLASALKISAVHSWCIFLELVGLCQCHHCSSRLYRGAFFKIFNLLYVEPASLLTSSVVLRGEDFLHFIAS